MADPRDERRHETAAGKLGADNDEPVAIFFPDGWHHRRALIAIWGPAWPFWRASSSSSMLSRRLCRACAMRLVRNKVSPSASRAVAATSASLARQPSGRRLSEAGAVGRQDPDRRYVIVECWEACFFSICGDASAGAGLGFSVGLVFIAVSCLTDLVADASSGASDRLRPCRSGLALLADFALWPDIGGPVACRDRLRAGADAGQRVLRAVQGEQFGKAISASWRDGAWLGPVAGIGVFRRQAGRRSRRFTVLGRASAMTRLPFGLFIRGLSFGRIYLRGILAPANIKSGSVTGLKCLLEFKSFRPRRRRRLSAVSLLLYGCGAGTSSSDRRMGPGRVEEKIIAPIKGVNERGPRGVRQPARSLIQVGTRRRWTPVFRLDPLEASSADRDTRRSKPRPSRKPPRGDPSAGHRRTCVPADGNPRRRTSEQLLATLRRWMAKSKVARTAPLAASATPSRCSVAT